MWRLARNDRFQRFGRDVKLGFELLPVAADTRSKLILPLLAASMLAKPRTRWRDRPGRLGVRRAGDDTADNIAGGRELEVLCEVALNEQYAPPEDLDPAVIVGLGAHVGL